jgi:hypothetical protein
MRREIMNKVFLANLFAAGIAEFVQKGGDTFVANSGAIIKVLRPFETENRAWGKWGDPLFNWSLNRHNRPEVEILRLLHNWYDETPPIGTLAENETHVEKCYAIRNYANDPTFRNFFWTAWSRDEFENHRTLTGNAVPGVLIGKEKEKLLNGNSYRLGAECIWIPVANYLKPNELYLCGGWGRYVIDFVRQALPETKVVLHCHPASRGHYFWKNGSLLPE